MGMVVEPGILWQAFRHFFLPELSTAVASGATRHIARARNGISRDKSKPLADLSLLTSRRVHISQNLWLFIKLKIMAFRFNGHRLDNSFF